MSVLIVDRLQNVDVVDFPNATASLCEEAAAVITDLLALALQYRDDLKYPPSGDSLERRVERINDVLAKLEASK